MSQSFSSGDNSGDRSLPDQDTQSEQSTELSCRVGPEAAGMRWDQFLAQTLPDATRAEAQRLIELPDAEEDGARVNGRRVKANYRLREGDLVTARRPPIHASHTQAEEIPLTVVFEDQDLMVIDKARGMVVHPAPGSETGTLVNAILAHADDLSGIGGEERPGIVHRLDKDTGGLLVIAKNDVAHRHLQDQIKTRTAQRRYLAIVWGSPHFTQATVDAPIGRHPIDRKKMAVITDPRHSARTAFTELTVQEQFEGLALIEAKLQTGRTHQIRVHCAYIHHPIVGDGAYGGNRKAPHNAHSGQYRAALDQAILDLNGQALHAYSLSFLHPRTGENLSFTVSLPPCMQTLLDLLRNPY